jgi:hypothetical protein
MGSQVFPSWLGVAFLPGAVATAFLPVIRNARLDISLHIWTSWCANLFFWALVGDLICVGWERNAGTKGGEDCTRLTQRRCGLAPLRCARR